MRARDVVDALANHDEQDALGHRPADLVEEGARQIGPSPFARARVHIKGEEGVPVLLRNVGPGQELDRQIRAERLPPLALDRLALARGERVEEIVKITITLVDEMELLARAQEKAFRRKRLRSGLGREGEMQRRSAARLA